MEHGGIDVHKNQSQICIFTEAGEVLHQRIHTNRERFAAVFAERPTARILIEASTESEWVAQCLEVLGHEVIVADPNYAPMYAQRSRRVKTDRRDAEALAHACRLGAYHPGTSDVGASAAGAGEPHRTRCFGAEPHTVDQCGARAVAATRLSPAEWSSGVLYWPDRRT